MDVNNKLEAFWVTGSRRICEYYRNRRVLVTGADGFLGVNTIHALQQLGAIVSIISRREEPRAGGKIDQVYKGDLGDTKLLHEAVENQDIIFNFAGVSSSVESNRHPEKSLDEECRIHMRLIHACSESRTKPLVIFSSTRLVYGKPNYRPVDESHPLLPMSMYAVNKITVENYLRLFSQANKLGYLIFRLSNPYGPFQRSESTGYGIINRFIQNASEGKKICLFGDGKQRRDYIFINDVVSIMLAAGAKEKCRDQIFNLGGREQISLVDAATCISKHSGKTSIEHVPWPDDYRQVETGDYASDISKLEKYISIPSMITFDNGVKFTLEYYRQLKQ